MAVSAALVVAAFGAAAQERLSPLHGLPRPGVAERQLKAAGVNEYYVYQYAPQTLPVIDDFSIDRTRHLDARSGDADVTLDRTIYHLSAAGASTPGMVFSNEATFRYVVTLGNDTTVDTLAIPPVEVTVRDLSVYPPTEVNVAAWPAYDLYDTVGHAFPDTLRLSAPHYVQDSLLVYVVAQAGGTYINPDGSSRPLILWQEDEAFVNNTYGADPPTIGVATFDGMDRTGYPYSPDAPNAHGIADRLTSVPIDLTAVPGDSIYLSYFIQPVGRSGDSAYVQAEDSLFLEFYAPGESRWYKVRRYPQVPVHPFTQEMVPITDTRYLQNGFRMRFSNMATLGGPVDQWNIDYVRLGRNRAHNDTELNDVAFVYPANTLLQTYTSVPLRKFLAAPAGYMAPSIDLLQKNLYTQDKFITWGYVSALEGQAPSGSFSNYGSNISNNAGSTFNTTHPVNSAPNNYVYDVPAGSDAAFIRTKFWTQATPDACRYNDTTTVRQELSNYYSYDDGSAEWGYSLRRGAGGKIAFRFDTQGEDSLRALRVYFDPIFTYGDVFNNPRAGSFLISVWTSLQPERMIFQNISYSTPQYRRWGPDHFIEYPLDSAIAVNGTFYVGWVQTNDMEMNLGFDVDRVNNDRMFLNLNGSWANSSFRGSWMIRPVMVAAVDPWAGVSERDAARPGLSVYPNPATGAFMLHYEGDAVRMSTVELLEATGRAVRRWPRNTTAFSTADVSDGLYIVRVIDAEGRSLAQSRLMVQH
ncbi:MAG: T9SS type A sorting domain-containing protein [Flavobacteriales bacterium]